MSAGEGHTTSSDHGNAADAAGRTERGDRRESMPSASIPAGVEEALARVRQVLDDEPDYMFWKDRDSVYLGCNQRFAEAAGLTDIGEIVGKTDHDLIWTESEADFYREVDRRVMETKAPEYHIIETQLQADGRRLWIDTSKLPFFDDDGRVAGLVGVYSDITDRIESAKVLSHGTEILRAMTHAAQAMVKPGDWTAHVETVLALAAHVHHALGHAPHQFRLGGLKGVGCG